VVQFVADVVLLAVGREHVFLVECECLVAREDPLEQVLLAEARWTCKRFTRSVLTTEYHPTAKDGSTKNKRCNALRSQDNKRVGSLVVTDTGATL
jgi:hypothetical protein